MKLTNRKILLGVSGGIAAYKSAYLTRLLIRAGAEVQVVMTEAATKFVTPLTFESLTDRPVAVEMFPTDRFVATRHISFAKWPDVIVISPATADLIAQVANGFCSTLLATIICATKKRVLWAPSMNEGMYTNPTVQGNIDKLRLNGHIMADVGVGEMACKSYGPGRMAEPEEIFELIVSELKGNGPLRGRKVVVTAGPCREAIDPVRYISNRSSGKMGFALAIQAERLGAEVTLVSGPVALDDPAGVEVVRVENTEQMAEAVGAAFKDADYLIMAAAPADYKTAESSPQKIKKGDQNLNITLIPTIDILRNIASVRTNSQTVVGFSLETENDLENGKKKLQEKRLDFIVINNPMEEGAGFDTDTNRVTIVSKSGDVRVIDKDDKDVIAEKIWEYIITDGIR